MTNVIVVHGTGGHDADWLPSIGEKLNQLNIQFKIPHLPNEKPIHARDWITGIHDYVKVINGSITFVGYSLGTRAILLYLEKYPIKAEHVLLVAAFANDVKNAKADDGEYHSFFTHKIDTVKIKKNVGDITILHSEDDWSIPYEQAVELSKELNAELITYKDRGHFTDSKCADDVLKVLKDKLKK